MSAEDRRKQFERKLAELNVTLQVGIRVTDSVPLEVTLELAEWAYRLGWEGCYQKTRGESSHERADIEASTLRSSATAEDGSKSQ
jgi:hypothetical protein